ncbi:ABC-2 type transport system permease protein [Streptomyces sp. DvalAA-14]|uniref:ABC transporter permease n=1 Tax=unclassified Streptomyces TaxID=2593676 RepID=UPI00081B3D69|nr:MULTISPECIES: ABC transporter permease [unclassified Streptomyces]MYS19434.1 ABC transporter permease [Streptomyces sp. SID4948]SCD44305.1 ABC-2 type transport system permease protein [Streptomyces sp. DvalAA-14]
MKTLIRLEIRRTLRNRKFMFFSVLYPAMLFIGTSLSYKKTDTVGGDGLSALAYLMVAMAAFGAMTAVLMGNAERIAREREKGWVRQLRLTALPGRGYVTAKIASAATVSLPSILVVLVLGATVKGIRLDAWQWVAIAFSIWAGSLVFAALGVAIGYLATADVARPISMLFYFGLALLGGLWVPIFSFPQWLQTIAGYLPARPYAALGQSIELGDAPHAKDVTVLVVYLLLFAGSAAWLYRKDTRKA